MKNLLASIITAAAALVNAGDALDAPGNFNPMVPGYFADPTLKKFGDIYYLYATTDGNGGGRGPATVWVSKDFVNWTLVPMNWPTTPHYWAPDVVKRPDGRFYLFYNQPCNTFGGVSDTPIGPWTPLTPGDGLVIRDRLVKDVITLDTQFFEDKDGTLYGYWGTWGIFPNSGCGYGVFNPDLKSFARLGMIPNTQAKDFFEGPVMIERNGVYYFTYSSGSCHDASYRVQYAVGSKPDGDFKMGPNNPILATTPDGLVHGPGHHGIYQEGNDYYIIYHRHDIPVTPNGMHRQTCADRLVFEGDGAIKKVELTHKGIGLLGAKTALVNLAFTKPVTASSFYQDTLRKHAYKPEYAVDNNNATLWRPGDNRMGHWLTVDLGAPQKVRRTLTQFEYATWYYQYLIEVSVDGQNWKTFADRRQNTRWGSPMVDDGEADARYLRLTVTGTEYPGLFGSVWNFKALAEAPKDPLHELADKSFNEFIVPKQAKNQNPRAQLPATGAQPIIHLDVAALPLGAALPAWTNLGSLGGEFKAGDNQPSVGLAAGRKAVRFAGKEILRASFPAPRSLAGNSCFTVAAWINNPVIGESECIVSWAGRGGPDAATAQVGYGTQREWGAVGHWGFADMGFRGEPPKAGQWHHLAVVFDGVIERLYVDGKLNNSEAKMLMMHQGRPIYVGASEPGAEFLDGYLASLRIYDRALTEAAIEKLVQDQPAAEVLIHVDAAQLDYGPLKSWENNGSLGGRFTAQSDAPAVRDASRRMAVDLGQRQSMELALDAAVPLADFTWLLTAASASGTPIRGAAALVDAQGQRAAFPAFGASAGWQQGLLRRQAGKTICFVNGKPTTWMPPQLPDTLKAMLLGGDAAADVLLTRAQLFRRALSDEEVGQVFALWQRELRPIVPDPGVFAQKPTALTPNIVVMAAQASQSEAGGLEYLFTDASGKSSGWLPSPVHLVDGLAPSARHAYSVKSRDALGNVSAASAAVEMTTDANRFSESADNFTAPRDYLAQGTQGTIWDGVLGQEAESKPEAVAVRDGVLRLQSKGTVWDGGKPRGALVYKLVAGDFVAQVKVADYAGLANRRPVGNNDGGLMARVARLEDAGSGDDLVQLTFFPPWNQGNMVTSLDSGARPQKGNMMGFDAHRYLQLIRHGNRFYFRASPDGQNWQNLPGSPIERKDMNGLPLQVGLCHASYGGESSFIAFSEFKLWIRK